jgi:hypothetical protein
MGIDEEKAREVVRSCHGFLAPIRRHPTLVSTDFESPRWAVAAKASSLITALLANSWEAENPDDRAAISSLAGAPYKDVEMQLKEAALSSDPPLRRVRDTWQVISRDYVWTQLGAFIGATELKRLGEVGGIRRPRL